MSKRAEAEALFFAGNGQMADGDLAGAEASFRAALELAPDFAEAHANFAYLLERAGALPEAEAHYRHSIAADPGIAQTHVNLGVLLAGQKRFAEAEAVYREDLTKYPGNGWSLRGLATALEMQKKSAEAATVEARFAAAWARADTSLETSCFCVRKGRADAPAGTSALAQARTAQR